MAAASPSSMCATCETLVDVQKPKLGILLCIGCQKNFCARHIAQHRQDLTDLLETTVVNERNVLQEQISTLTEQQWSDGISVQMGIIDRWETEAIELVKLSAATARQKVHEMIHMESGKLDEKFVSLSHDLNTLRENENYFENDIEQLTKKFEELSDEIKQFPIATEVNTIPYGLILVEFVVPPTLIPPSPLSSVTASPSLPVYTFLDQLVATSKSRTSVNLSAVKPGRMYPISDKQIAFYSSNALPAIDTSTSSWQSLKEIGEATEVYWSAYLKKFLILLCGNNSPWNGLHQFDPYSGTRMEIFPSSAKQSGSESNILTVAYDKQRILLVFRKKIELWSINSEKWHTDGVARNCWRPPVSCQANDEIKCIRMTDQYYALVINAGRTGLSMGIFYFELRNHGMSTIHRIQTDYCCSPHATRLLRLPRDSGWLFFSRCPNNEYCYVLDDQMKRYDQKFVFSSDISDVAVQDNLILLRQQNKSNGSDVLLIYDWPQ